jgi:L-iditol 2-dehydrogenase
MRRKQWGKGRVHMKAVLLEDVKKLAVRTIADPVVQSHEVLIRVRAVGVCGTDIHIYQGHGNWNFDGRGAVIPLTEKPQILGHEFCGEIVKSGSEVKDLAPGDRVLCDQGINCMSRGRKPLCDYCRSGDSHQCDFYGEHGVTGLQGALAEYICMPAVNCLKIPQGMSFEQGALVEPLGCIIHAFDWADRTHARFTFSGPRRIRTILICGAGPAGLLFLQYLRNVKKFDGQILVADMREKNLGMVGEFSGTPVNMAQGQLAKVVLDHTNGERVHYFIDACGSADIFVHAASLLARQGTLLLYGAGHKGRDIGLLSSVLFLEPALVTSVGASGGFDPDGRPATYRRALELISRGTIAVLPLISHRYASLESIHKAFDTDSTADDYIKGVLILG